MRTLPLSLAEIKTTGLRFEEQGRVSHLVTKLNHDGSFNLGMVETVRDVMAVMFENIRSSKSPSQADIDLANFFSGDLAIDGPVSPDTTFSGLLFQLGQFLLLLPTACHVTPERRVGVVTLAIANLVDAAWLGPRAYRDNELVHDGQIPQGGHCDRLFGAWVELGNFDPEATDEINRILELAGFKTLDDVIALGRELYESRSARNTCGDYLDSEHHKKMCLTCVD